MRSSMIVKGLGVGLLTFAAISANAGEVFKVCADPLNPPYSTAKKDGFENKIAELFAKQLGQKVEYTWFPQRIGFIRKTLTAPLNESEVDSEEFKCDVVMGVPAGFEMTLTTKPYYRSQYVLLIAKGRGWDDIKTPADLADLPLERQDALKIAMFDRGPGTAWLQKNGLLEQGISYQSMSGDEKNNIAMQLDQDLTAKKIDMVILWGPLAGYILKQHPAASFKVLPMQSSPGMKFDFSMAMGVRNGDKERKAALDRLIVKNEKKIQSIIADYRIPLLPLEKETVRHDDDD
jgi:quinoprotein dehydrogenase-associated probable ABC transporter substrate-binding protein